MALLILHTALYFLGGLRWLWWSSESSKELCSRSQVSCSLNCSLSSSNSNLKHPIAQACKINSLIRLPLILFNYSTIRCAYMRFAVSASSFLLLHTYKDGLTYDTLPFKCLIHIYFKSFYWRKSFIRLPRLALQGRLCGLVPFRVCFAIWFHFQASFSITSVREYPYSLHIDISFV